MAFHPRSPPSFHRVPPRAVFTPLYPHQTRCHPSSFSLRLLLLLLLPFASYPSRSSLSASHEPFPRHSLRPLLPYDCLPLSHVSISGLFTFACALFRDFAPNATSHDLLHELGEFAIRSIDPSALKSPSILLPFAPSCVWSSLIFFHQITANMPRA